MSIGTYAAPALPLSSHGGLLQAADWIEQAALQDLYAAAPRSVRSAAGLFVERTGGVLTLGAPGIGSSMLSRVFVPQRASTDDVGDAVDRLHRAGVQRYLAHVHAMQSQDLQAVLAARGVVRYHRAWFKLAAEARNLPSLRPSLPDSEPTLRVAQREHGEQFADFVVRCLGIDESAAALLSSVVSRPRWHVYFAMIDGEPVATGALFVHGDLGHLAFGATLPSHRGRGLQRLLIAKRMRVALAQGCRVIVSETGEPTADEGSPSLHNLMALGLRPIATRDNYVRQGVRFG